MKSPDDCADCRQMVTDGRCAECRVGIGVERILTLKTENAKLRAALKAANALISEFNSYSTGCACLAEEDVAQLFGEYTEALESCDVQHTHNTREKP